MKLPLIVTKIAYCIDPFFGSLHAVTLTFDLLTPKSNRNICDSKHICDQNWVKFTSLVFEIIISSYSFNEWSCCSQGLRDAHCRLSHSQTDRPEYNKPPAPSYRATAYNATHCIAVAILSVCLSVRPSARCVYCNKTKWWTADIFIPRGTAITLVFWHQQWLVGDAPFPVKYSPKVIHRRAKLIVPCNQYFIRIRQMALRSRYSCLSSSDGDSPCTEPLAVLTQWHNGLLGRMQSHGLSAIAELLVQLWRRHIWTNSDIIRLQRTYLYSGRDKDNERWRK